MAADDTAPVELTNGSAVVTVAVEATDRADGVWVPVRYIVTGSSGYQAVLPACGCETRTPCGKRRGHQVPGKAADRDAHNRTHCHGWHLPAAQRFAADVLATYPKPDKPRHSRRKTTSAAGTPATLSEAPPMIDPTSKPRGRTRMSIATTAGPDADLAAAHDAQLRLFLRTRRDVAVTHAAECDDPQLLADLVAHEQRPDVAAALAGNARTPDHAIRDLHLRYLPTLAQRPASTAAADVSRRLFDGIAERIDPFIAVADLTAHAALVDEATTSRGRFIYPFRRIAERLLDVPKWQWVGGERVLGPDPLDGADRHELLRQLMPTLPDVLAWEICDLVCWGRVPGVTPTTLLALDIKVPFVLAAVADSRDGTTVTAELATALLAHADAWQSVRGRFDLFQSGWRQPAVTADAAEILASSDVDWALTLAARAPLGPGAARSRLLAAAGKDIVHALTRDHDLTAAECAVVLDRAHGWGRDGVGILRLLADQPALPADQRPQLLAEVARRGHPEAAARWLARRDSGNCFSARALAPQPTAAGVTALCEHLTPAAGRAVVDELLHGDVDVTRPWMAALVDQLPGLAAAAVRQPDHPLAAAACQRIRGLVPAERFDTAQHRAVSFKGSVARLAATVSGKHAASAVRATGSRRAAASAVDGAPRSRSAAAASSGTRARRASTTNAATTPGG